MKGNLSRMFLDFSVISLFDVWSYFRFLVLFLFFHLMFRFFDFTFRFSGLINYCKQFTVKQIEFFGRIRAAVPNLSSAGFGRTGGFGRIRPDGRPELKPEWCVQLFDENWFHIFLLLGPSPEPTQIHIKLRPILPLVPLPLTTHPSLPAAHVGRD